MKGENTAKLLEAERDKLKKLEEKQRETSEKIRSCKANITKYELMLKNEKLNALDSIISDKGLTIEDVLSLIESGKINSLIDNSNKE